MILSLIRPCTYPQTWNNFHITFSNSTSKFIPLEISNINYENLIYSDFSLSHSFLFPLCQVLVLDPFRLWMFKLPPFISFSPTFFNGLYNFLFNSRTIISTKSLSTKFFVFNSWNTYSECSNKMLPSSVFPSVTSLSISVQPYPPRFYLWFHI